MITKVEKISEPLMKSILDGSITLKKYNKNKDIINSRCDYIVRKIMEIQEVTEFVWWDFENRIVDENIAISGYFDPDLYAFTVQFTCGLAVPHSKDLWKLPYETEFPTRWIWMDFEEECQREYQKAVRQWEKSKSGMKAKKEEEKIKKEKIKKEALQKLTPEEREVLGY